MLSTKREPLYPLSNRTLHCAMGKQMLSKTGIDRFSGILLLLMLVTSIVGAGFASGVGTDYNVPADEVAEVLQLVR